MRQTLVAVGRGPLSMLAGRDPLDLPAAQPVRDGATEQLQVGGVVEPSQDDRVIHLRVLMHKDVAEADRLPHPTGKSGIEDGMPTEQGQRIGVVVPEGRALPDLATVQTPRSTRLVRNWPWTRSEAKGEVALPRERAASRVESYVYGNVLVLAVVAASDATSVADGQAALLVVGTALSTFIAHVLAVVVAHPGDEDGPGLRDSVRDSVPIATSGLLPALVLLAGWQGWLSVAAAVVVALASIVVRFVLLGSVVSYLDGEQSTWKNLLIGVGLAVAGIVVAGVKLLLTH
jgi:hypothetical protein